MNEMTLRRIVLPDGSEATISLVPLAWWDENNASGFVAPAMCAPDPNQPRRHIRKEALDELIGSIRVSGVREPVILTPRHLAPWVELAPEHESAYFVIVSGHRRWTGATRSKLEAVPFCVRTYGSAAEHYMDASLLNSNREDLTPLEEGYEALSLRERGFTMEALSSHFGKSVPYLYSRMNLTRLAPDIQVLLDPEVNERKRLPVTIGGELGGVKVPTVGELDEILERLGPACYSKDGNKICFESLDDDGRRFELQRMLLRAIQREQMSASRAIILIKDQAQRLSAQQAAPGKKSERLQPARRRKMLRRFVGEVNGSSVHDWRPADYREAFETAPDEEIDSLLAELRIAEENIGSIATLVERARAARPER